MRPSLRLMSLTAALLAAATLPALAQTAKATLKTADGKTVDWRRALIQKCAEIQNADGSWVGIPHEMENNPVLVTSYVILALQDAQADLKAHPAK